MKYVKGGTNLKVVLEKISKNSTSKAVEAGFLENAIYANGLQVATVVYWNEFGAVINAEDRKTTIFRKTNKDGNFAKEAKFVKASQSNFATEHNITAHSVTIPARPFFRMAIENNKTKWADEAEKLLVKNNYNVTLTLELLGKKMVGDIQQSIKDFHNPPNAPATVKKKGFDDPLIDKGTMLRSVDSRVVNKSGEEDGT